MSQARWTAVDQYLNVTLVHEDEGLQRALEDSAAAGLPEISVTPSQGKFLHILALAIGARRILELGTLGGYSTIWMARALPDGGRLVTIEADPEHAAVARINVDRAGVGKRVDICTGRGLDVLPQLAAERGGPFDLIFIDANKDQYPEYFDWAVRLSRPGTVIVADNVIRDGRVVDAAVTDEATAGIRRFLAALGSDGRVTSTAIQTVGAKGHDGLALVRVN